MLEANHLSLVFSSINGAIHDLFLIGLIGGKDELTKEKQLELWLHLVS